MKAFTAALEPEKQYVGPNSSICPKIGLSIRKNKGKEETKMKKKKRKETIF